MWLATAARAAAVPEVAITFLISRGGDAIDDAIYFARDEAAKTLQFALAGGIVTQEFIGEANRAERKADRVANVSALRDRQFATAATQIHHERRRVVHAAAGDESEVNEPRLFHAGNDLDSPTGGRTHPFQKRL